MFTLEGVRIVRCATIPVGPSHCEKLTWLGQLTGASGQRADCESKRPCPDNPTHARYPGGEDEVSVSFLEGAGHGGQRKPGECLSNVAVELDLALGRSDRFHMRTVEAMRRQWAARLAAIGAGGL